MKRTLNTTHMIEIEQAKPIDQVWCDWEFVMSTYLTTEFFAVINDSIVTTEQNGQDNIKHF